MSAPRRSVRAARRGSPPRIPPRRRLPRIATRGTTRRRPRTARSRVPAARSCPRARSSDEQLAWLRDAVGEEVRGSRGALGHVERTEPTSQPLSVGTPVRRRSGDVDGGHREAVGAQQVHDRAVRPVRRSCRTGMHGHDERGRSIRPPEARGGTPQHAGERDALVDEPESLGTRRRGLRRHRGEREDERRRPGRGPHVRHGDDALRVPARTDPPDAGRVGGDPVDADAGLVELHQGVVGGEHPDVLAVGVRVRTRERVAAGRREPAARHPPGPLELGATTMESTHDAASIAEVGLPVPRGL